MDPLGRRAWLSLGILAVVMGLLPAHYMLLQRNLLYTGVTRARRLCVLVGSKRAIGMAVGNDKVARRYTGLARRLRERPAERVLALYRE